MCLGLRPGSAQPDAGQLDVWFTEDEKNRRRSMARNRLLEDEAIDGPDLLVALFLVRRLGLRMVGVMVRVR